MGCACNKRRQQTAYGSTTPAPEIRRPEPEKATPVTLQLPNGDKVTYGSRLEGHAARIRLGGKFV